MPMSPLSSHINATDLVEAKIIERLLRFKVVLPQSSAEPMTDICQQVVQELGLQETFRCSSQWLDDIVRRHQHEIFIWKALQEIHDQGELFEKPTDWLYVYFCSSLGYDTTCNLNGTYSHRVKDSLKDDPLELKPCDFSEFGKVYQRFVNEADPRKFQTASTKVLARQSKKTIQKTPKQAHARKDDSISRQSKKTKKTFIQTQPERNEPASCRQSKRSKKTPAQADQEKDQIVQNRAATEKLLIGLKKKGIIQYTQGQKLFYPQAICSFRRCILRAMYGLVAKKDRNRDDVHRFFQQHAHDLTLFSDIPRTQQVMDACPVPLEGELVYVGCHWMALNETMLIDDGQYFRLLVDYETARKAIVGMFEDIECQWDFLRRRGAE